MLVNFLSIFRVFGILFIMSLSFSLFAQPSNDRCSFPTLLELGSDSSTCILVRGDTRETEDATMVEEAPEVCSGSWFTDDVWFSFNTGDEVPAFGVTVEVRLDPTSGTELIEHGLAIYQDCDSETSPIDCFSDMPGRRTIEFPATCMAPNSSYLIRLWSAPEARSNEGTFSICAYETPQDTTGLNEPIPRIIYEETFDEGFNGWESVSLTQSFNIHTGEMVDDHWMWSNTGCFTTAFGTNACLIPFDSVCVDQGVVGVPAGFYQVNWDPGSLGDVGPPPYPNINTYIVSPPINLSNESCVNLTWNESARFLNGGTLSSLGSYVQYSLDDGVTWLNPSNAIGSADVSVNYGGEYVVNGAVTNALERSIPLIGAEGNSNVRIRYGFDGDFYFWIIDNVRIVEDDASDIIAHNNSFARSTINPMSIHMLDSYDFMIDIANLSCEDLTNVNANMTITNSAGEEVYNANLAYGNIQSDSLAINKPFLRRFIPSNDEDTYTHTYTITADNDDKIGNGVRSFQTNVVDELIFRKEDGIANGSFSPNPNVFWEEGEPYQWEMGNIFTVPNEFGLYGNGHASANEISFHLTNPTELIGDVLNIGLYEISDNNFDNIINKDDNTEITKLAFAQYEVKGFESSFITVGLEALDPEQPWLQNLITLKGNTHYMATIENTTETIRPYVMRISANDSYDYSRALFNSRQLADGDITKIRYGHSFAISKENYFRIGPGNSDDDSTGNFSENGTPLIRLGYTFKFVDGPIDGPVSTAEINNAIKIVLSPNPTASELTLNLSVDEATDMQISIVDLSGKELITKSHKAVTELTETFDVSNLAIGVYLIHINTKDGVRTEKFVVSR